MDYKSQKLLFLYLSASLKSYVFRNILSSVGRQYRYALLRLILEDLMVMKQ